MCPPAHHGTSPQSAGVNEVCAPALLSGDGTDGRWFESDGRCHLPSGYASLALESQPSRRTPGGLRCARRSAENLQRSSWRPTGWRSGHTLSPVENLVPAALMVVHRGAVHPVDLPVDAFGGIALGQGCQGKVLAAWADYAIFPSCIPAPLRFPRRT